MFSPPSRLAASLATGLMLMAGCSQAQDQRPAAIQALEQQGLTIIQEFDAGAPVRTFAAVAGDRPVAVYLMQDGSAIVGTRLDADGQPLDDAALEELVAKPMSDQAWAQLESSSWVLDGQADAPRIVYTFTDANCPFCNRFWEAARPWVDAGKVQLRHVMVGVIKEDSLTKAAAILGAADPSAALAENERKHQRGGIAPARSVPTEIGRQLEDNHQLMLLLGFRGTPGIVVKGAEGLISKHNGMPRPEALADIMGPR